MPDLLNVAHVYAYIYYIVLFLLFSLEWYTSGKRNPSEASSYLWESTNQPIKTVMFWTVDKNALKDGDHIIYKKEGAWGKLFSVCCDSVAVLMSFSS